MDESNNSVDNVDDVDNADEIYKLLLNKEFYQYYDGNRSLPQDKKASKYLKLNSYQSICKNYMNPKLNNKRLLLMHQPGCHKRGTKIYLADHSVKRVEDVVLGDKLLGDDLKPRLVTTLCRGFGKMYKIEYAGIGEFTCNEDHILTVIIDKMYITDVTVKRLIEDGFSQHGSNPDGGSVLSFCHAFWQKANNVFFCV